MIEPTLFVSPLTRMPLIRKDDSLVTPDGSESYPIEQGGLIRLDLQTDDDALVRERELFDSLPIQGVSYFLPRVYRQMMKKLGGYLRAFGADLGTGFRFAELGGGEGHCASYVKEQEHDAAVFVCDISRTALSRAPGTLQRACTDITRPIFAPGTLQAAAFWVSLHHIPAPQRRQALTEAYTALAEGGILILFEPNRSFVVRDLVYRSRLRHDVYFDEEETSLDFDEITSLAQDVGFTELETTYLNPPYNPNFVRQLRRWWLFLPAVSALFLIGQLMHGLQTGDHSSRMKHVALYGMSFFRKSSRVT